MNSRAKRSRRTKQSTRRNQSRSVYSGTVFETLPSRPVNPFIQHQYRGATNVRRTRPIRRRQFLTDTLYSPYSKTVQGRRFDAPLGPFQRNHGRHSLLGRTVGNAQRRNPCAQRAARKAVLFAQKLIGFAGSSPGGPLRKYIRKESSNFSCR